VTLPRPNRPLASRMALRLLVVAALVVVVARFAWAVFGALDVFADYHAYYRAAANLRAGADLYAEGHLLVTRNSYAFWTQTDGQYVYPPALAILLLPLTALDIGRGGPVWLLALVLATLGFIWLAARLCGRPARLAALLAVALPVAGLLPLALGVCYGLIARFPVLLALVALGGQVAFTWALRRSARRPNRATNVVALALLASGLLALLLGLRDRQIDRFLLALATPGLLGMIALNWARAAGRRKRLPEWLRASIGRDLVAVIPIALPVLGATPLLLGIHYGQADLFLLLLTTLSLLAHQRRRDALAGIALGLAAAVKPTLALYGLYYLRKRCWTTLATAALTGATLGLAPFALLGSSALTDWLAISRYFGGGDYLAYPSNQSLRGFLLRALVGGPEHTPLFVNRPLAAALWVAGGIAALSAWWWCLSARREPDRRAVAEWSLTAVLILFAAPLSEDIHYVGLLLPLAVLAARIARGAGKPRWQLWAFAACLAFVLPLNDLAAQVTHGTLARLLASASYLYGLALVGGVLIAWLRTEAATQTSPQSQD
jgi:hypothetical protein